MDSDYENYFIYLRNRSYFGLLYRRFWLYPFLSRNLKGKVLDVGCGIGDFLNYHPHSVGVDINPSMINFCKESGHEVYLMKSNKLPFASGEFDSVIMDNVLEHLYQPEELLSEIHRVLSPNGRLVIGVPGYKGYVSDTDHKIFYDQLKLKTTVTKAGFAWVKTKTMPLPIEKLQEYLNSFAWYGFFDKESNNFNVSSCINKSTY